jgi:hypothetical protein
MTEEELAMLIPAESPLSISETTLRKSLGLAAPLILNTADAWQNAAHLEHRQSIQSLVFPEGIVFDQLSGSYRTAKTSDLFKLFRLSARRPSYVVAGVRCRLNQLAQDITALANLSREMIAPDDQLRLAA